MNRQHPNPSLAPAPRRRPLWLAVVNGLPRPPHPPVSPIDEPETPLTVEFEGLTPEEQRAALAAFPGGRRFQLATEGN